MLGRLLKRKKPKDDASEAMGLRLGNISFTGPQFEVGSPVSTLLPPNLAALLQQINGFIQFGGGLHVRGVCSAPDWHSLAHVMVGEKALHRSYPAVVETDVPFAQDCVADQFLLRGGVVHKLYSETGDIEDLDLNLPSFFAAVEADPIGFLSMHPLLQFQRDGGALLPGQVLHVYPPFCTKEAGAGVSLKPVSAIEALEFLAEFSSQLTGMAEGAKFRIQIVP